MKDQRILATASRLDSLASKHERWAEKAIIQMTRAIKRPDDADAVWHYDGLALEHRAAASDLRRLAQAMREEGYSGTIDS